MNEKRVPAVRTPIEMAEFLSAVKTAWPRALGNEPTTRSARCVLYAQYWIETGGRACFNWNLGNVKHAENDGFDYYCLDGVWEGVSPVTAQRLIASGEAFLDRNSNHISAVGPGRVAVFFKPPHPQTRFRAYASLEDGIEEHLKFIKARFASAWPYILAGDYVKTAYALKARGYFTADAAAYAAGMRSAFEKAMDSQGLGIGPELGSTKAIQLALNRLGYDAGPVDGIPGARTIDALRKFQRDRGLLADGICGPITQGALSNAIAMV